MADRPQLVTAAEAAELLGIPASRIHKWKHRGRVKVKTYAQGSGRGGLVPVYDLEVLRAKLADTP